MRINYYNSYGKMRSESLTKLLAGSMGQSFSTFIAVAAAVDSCGVATTSSSASDGASRVAARRATDAAGREEAGANAAAEPKTVARRTAENFMVQEYST